LSRRYERAVDVEIWLCWCKGCQGWRVNINGTSDILTVDASNTY